MKYFIGEFDPGSGRTLAACLTHASRTEILLKLAIKYLSGGRVSNAWVIYLLVGNNSWKRLLIPHKLREQERWPLNMLSLKDEPASD